MVWNQDLAKLKQQLKEEGDPAPLPAPKPVPPSQPSRSIVEEDATFLAAMGKPVSIAPNPGDRTPSDGTPPTPLALPAIGAEFQDALGSLHGLRPLARNPVFSALPQAPSKLPGVESRVVPTPQAKPDPGIPVSGAPLLDSSQAVQIPPGKEPPGPRLIHLAAGMAIEVEAILDLRGHSVHDAKERLKERLQDAVVLGWRTLHVILGPSEALRQAFLAFLLTPPARILAQYAQAPIPMGGNHAFIVYFVGPAV